MTVSSIAVSPVNPPAVTAQVLSTPSTLGCQLQGVATSPALTLLSQMLAQPQSPAGIINPNYLFWVMLVSGNISRCQGCSGKIERSPNGKPLPPPDDIVEQILFLNPNTGVFQLSHDFRNVYYHARKSCISRKFFSFQAGRHLRVNGVTLSKLTEVHTRYILNEFGVKFVSN